MLRFFNKRLHNRKGFTLIELIVVIAILAILAMIAIPAYTQYKADAQIKADMATAKILYDAALTSDAINDDGGTGWAAYVDAASYVAGDVGTVDTTSADYNGQVYP